LRLFSIGSFEVRARVRAVLPAVLLIAGLQRPAVASPGTPPPESPDRSVRVDARVDVGTAPDSPPAETLVVDGDNSGATPWIDLGPSKVLEQRAERPARRLAAPLTLAGIYAGFVTWTYFAWYRTETHEFRAGGDGSWKIWQRDGWFGTEQYAGGADKLGHAWATLALGRASTEILHQWGGYSRLTSALVGAALSEALFLGVEIKDGFAYRFSYGDFAFNTLGAALGFAQSMWPALDDAIDLRVQYFPSAAYRAHARNGDLDVAEDYSGQTYLLAFHLGAIRPLRTWRWGSWAPYVDVVLGFESRGYKPDPPWTITPEMPDYDKSRTTFIGLSLNAQGLFDRLLRGRSEAWRKVTHGAFEVFNLPYTTLPLVRDTAVPTGMVGTE
jgi:hypothetical protein